MNKPMPPRMPLIYFQDNFDDLRKFVALSNQLLEAMEPLNPQVGKFVEPLADLLEEIIDNGALHTAASTGMLSESDE